MFTQTWKKYLAVITILLKRSANGDQTLKMNNTDFERAAGGRKIKYSFTCLRLNKGRVDSSTKPNVMATDLAQVLMENDQTRPMIKASYLEFSMNNDFLLTIRNNTAAIEAQKNETVESTDNG
jgi:hypothetical protein